MDQLTRHLIALENTLDEAIKYYLSAGVDRMQIVDALARKCDELCNDVVAHADDDKPTAERWMKV